MTSPIKTIVFLFSIALAGCAHPSANSKRHGDSLRFERPRVAYGLQRVGPLLVTNSPTMNENVIRKLGDGVALTAGWLIANAGETPVRIGIDQVKIKINSDVVAMNCIGNGSPGPQTLEPRKKLMLACQATVHANSQNQLLNKDTKAAFEIPFESDGPKVISTDILLRIEDFER